MTRIEVEETRDNPSLDDEAALGEVYRAAFLDPTPEGALGEGGLQYFLALVRHPDVSIFVARAGGRRPVGVAVLARNLDVVDYIDREYFQRLAPGAVARNKLYYLPYAIVHPAYQRQGVLDDLLVSLAKSLIRDDATMGFDVSQARQRRGLAQRFFDHLERLSPRAGMRAVDTHVFYLAEPRQSGDPLVEDGQLAEAPNERPAPPLRR